MPNEAKSLALRWLSQRSLTVREVQERLKERGFDAGSVEMAVADLVRVSLLDDRRVADQVIARGLARHEGPRHLAQRLVTRGVPRDVVDDVMQELRQRINWLEIAEPVGQRYDRSSPKGRARLVRRLAREGFPGSVIRQMAEGEGSDDSDGIEDY